MTSHTDTPREVLVYAVTGRATSRFRWRPWKSEEYGLMIYLRAPVEPEYVLGALQEAYHACRDYEAEHGLKPGFIDFTGQWIKVPVGEELSVAHV